MSYSTITTAEPCSICLEEIPCGGFGYVENCRHYFHLDCILSWYLQDKRTCPICRTSFHRALFWPICIKTEQEKDLLFKWQKQCFGLFGVTPLTSLHAIQSLHSDVLQVKIDGWKFAFENGSGKELEPNQLDNTKIVEPTGEADLELLGLHFHMEQCEHYFSTDLLPSQLRQLQQCGQVICSICATPSSRMLLTPRGARFQSDAQREEVFCLQKAAFMCMVGNHSLVIREHQDGLVTILYDQKEHDIMNLPITR